MFGKVLTGVLLSEKNPKTAVLRLMHRPKIPWWIRHAGKRIPVVLKPEERLTIEIADCMRELSLSKRYRGIWKHVPNEGKRSSLTGVILKAMGMLSGATDFSLSWPTGSGEIEIKVHPEVLSTEQEDYRDWCFEEGIKWACVTCEADTPEARRKAVAEFESHLVAWGAL